MMSTEFPNLYPLMPLRDVVTIFVSCMGISLGQINDGYFVLMDQSANCPAPL